MTRKLLPISVCLAVILSSVGTLAGGMNPSEETDEFNSLGGLWNPDGPTESATTHIVRPDTLLAANPGPLPAAADNSAGLPPVGNQQSQGSCTCWAIGYYHTTFIENRESPFDLTDPANQASPAFLYNVANGGYNGGSYMDDVADLIISNGVTSMAEMPYDTYDYHSWPSEDWIWVSGMKRKAASQNWLYVGNQGGMDALKAHIAAGNTATTGISVWSNFDHIRDFNNTYCSSERYGTDRGGHVVTICGYDDEKPTADGKGAFRMVNSWGTNWGDSGYWWMTYEALVDGYLGYSWIMYLESELDYSPSVVAKLNVSHPERGDIVSNSGLGIALAENSVQLAEKTLLGCPWIEDWYSGEVYPVQEIPFPEGTMAFDISEFLPFMVPSINHQFILTLDNSGDINGELLSMEILNPEWWEGDVSWETPLEIAAYSTAQTDAYVEPGLFVHLPIRIDSDLDFEHKAISEFWEGDGSELNPYIIHDYYVWGENAGCCIYLGNTTSHFTVSGCTVEEPSGIDWSDWYMDSGILFYGLAHGTAEGNAARHGQVGITVTGSTQVQVCGNNVSANDNGIFVYGSEGVAVEGNGIFQNEYVGLLSIGSQGNWVWHNNFVDNPAQAYDDTGMNFWDGGYPSGGNYWSDYSGLDMMSGPLQDQPCSDGIGDIPYTNIDGGMGAQDNYPLMEPWAPKLAKVPHAPIRINSNADFDEAHGVVNWATGDGTESNPWIIEGWDIDGTGHGYCIYIGNTTEYFIVRNCYLHEASGILEWPYYYDTGLIFYNVQNAVAENNNASSNNRFGIRLTESSNVILVNNTANSNYLYGIEVDDSNSITMVNNSVSDNMFGIMIFYSENNTLTANTLVNNGFSLLGDQLQHWNTQNIDTSNTVNGKALQYWKNHTSGAIPVDAGQVILANCTNVVIENQNICQYATIDISIGFSDNNAISNNTASNSRYGIFLSHSSNNTVFNNTISNNDYGLDLTFSDCNIIVNNNFINNTVQAYDDTGSNIWNDSYPSGGNYWSDFNGTDEYSGPDQDIPGADGIGDTPYTDIEGGMGAQDNYPLMEPWGTPELVRQYLQVQNSIVPGYKNLSNEPFETGIQIASTGAILQSGEHILQNKWISDPLTHSASIAGTWTFDMYGYVTNSSVLGGHLFASVYKESTGELLFETGRDDENVSAFETYHSFTWAHEAPDIMLDTGDRYYVEIWLDAERYGGAITESTVNPDFADGTDGWTFFNWGGGTSSWVSGAASIDVNRNDMLPVLLEQGGYWQQAFTPSSAPSSVSLNFSWTCSNYYNIYGANFYVFIDTFSGTPSVNSAIWSSSISGWSPWVTVGPLDVSEHVNSASTYYLKIAARATTPGMSLSTFRGMYDNVQVTWHVLPEFVLGFDHNSTPSSITGAPHTPPTSPANLTVEHWGEGNPYEHNTLNWTHDGSGFVDRFNIYRSESDTGPWEYVDSVPGNTFTFVDMNRGRADLILWWYVVEAQNVAGEDGNINAVREPYISSFNISISAGWNLISIPLILTDRSFESVLSSISGKWSVAKYYDSLDTADPWKTYRANGTSNDLTGADNAMGFWLYALENCTLTVFGEIPQTTQIPLHAGWNLVGYPAQTSRTVAEALWGTGADRVEAFDPSGPSLLREMGPGEYMMPGQGYWVHVVADSVWTVDW